VPAELEVLTKNLGGIVMRHSVAVRVFLVAIMTSASALLTRPGIADDVEQPLTVDHYVSVRSTAPSMSGQIAQIYVRERLRASTVLRAASLANRVVLFIHGGGTPAEVAFDVPYQDYSWMVYLVQAGFDVFAMDGNDGDLVPSPLAITMNGSLPFRRSRHRVLINALPKSDEDTVRKWLTRAVDEQMTVSALRKALKPPKPSDEKSFHITVPLLLPPNSLPNMPRQMRDHKA
jgi:hypothetical protein